MKTISTHPLLVRAIIFLMILLYSLLVFGGQSETPGYVQKSMDKTIIDLNKSGQEKESFFVIVERTKKS